MGLNIWRVATLPFLLSVGSVIAYAGARPFPGTEDIPDLMARATLVCKGEVDAAPTPRFVPSAEGMPGMTAVAFVRPDRCFKGDPHDSSIPVLFDGFVSGVDSSSFVLRKGDYRLFFLKPHDRSYEVVDTWFGALPVSCKLSSLSTGNDGMYLLELDLKAGLRDADHNRVLDSIRMLGNMKRLRSTRELKELAQNAPELLVKTYVWQALLRLKDYSVLPALAAFFASQPEPPHELLLPRDRQLEMYYELTREIAGMRDPSTLPFLERFAVTGKGSELRVQALQAMRMIESPHSAAAFLTALDDTNPDNAFSAMQGLLSLAGGSSIDWVPTWKQFDEAPQFYAAKCREWWRAEGQTKAAARSESSVTRPF